MFKNRAYILSHFILAAAAMLFPVSLKAQGLTQDPFSPGFSLFTGISSTAVLAVTRFVLVAALLIAGMVAYRTGYNWIYWEGNAKKALENKRSLSNALLVITALFFLLAMLKVFIGDYASLVF